MARRETQSWITRGLKGKGCEDEAITARLEKLRLFWPDKDYQVNESYLALDGEGLADPGVSPASPGKEELQEGAGTDDVRGGATEEGASDTMRETETLPFPLEEEVARRKGDQEDQPRLSEASGLRGLPEA